MPQCFGRAKARAHRDLVDGQRGGLRQVPCPVDAPPDQPVAGRRARGFPEAPLETVYTHAGLPGEVGDTEILLEVGGQPLEQPVESCDLRVRGDRRLDELHLTPVAVPERVAWRLPCRDRNAPCGDRGRAPPHCRLRSEQVLRRRRARRGRHRFAERARTERGQPTSTLDDPPERGQQQW